MRGRGHFSSLKMVLEQVLKRHRYEINNQKIFMQWKKIVGDKIASISRPYKIFDNKLYVALKYNHWMLELSYAKDEMIKKYIALFPFLKLKDIYFKFDPNRNYSSLEDEKNDFKFSLENIELDAEESVVEIPWQEDDKEVANRIESLKKTYLKVKKYIAKEKDPYRNVLDFKKEKNRSKDIVSELDDLYPTYGISSQFLVQKDDFQSFDLYS